MLLDTRISAEWKFFNWVTRDIDVPTDNQKVKIRYISVIDLRNDGTGGYPSITSGGIGHDKVTVRLVSQFNRGFDFKMTVYGKREQK